jgi:hypothetical protein
MKKAGQLEEHGMAEGDMDENRFTGQRLAAIQAGKKEFDVDGKTYRVTGNTADEKRMMEDLQADDGKHYDSFDDFVSLFDPDSFDDTEVHSAGREIRGYINGRNVMSWEFDDESKTSGYGNYDMTMLEEGVAEGTNPIIDIATRASQDQGMLDGYIRNLYDYVNRNNMENDPKWKQAEKMATDYHFAWSKKNGYPSANTNPELARKGEKLRQRALVNAVVKVFGQQGVAEGGGNVEIGQQMANDGITYSPEKENELIDLMAQYMKKSGMSPKSIRYYLSYDEDYISDQLSYLPKQGVAEGTGGRYADELAQQVFANNPNLDASGPARELLNAAYALAVQELGRRRAQSFFDDEDFPSDLVTAYAWEQQQDDYYKLSGRDDLPEMVAEGWDEMNAWLDQREKEKGTGRFDKKKSPAGGTEYSRKPETFVDTNTGPEATGGAPKRRGRTAGAAKSPERVTGKSYKYKSGRPARATEGLDSDGVMMTRPSNMSSESIGPGEQAEYDDEAGMAKDSLHTIVRSAKELERALRSNENLPEWVQEKIGQIKGMMSSVTDYILSTHERDAEQHMGREGVTLERAVSKDQAVAARIARGVQKGEVKARPGSASAEMAKMAPKELKKFAKTSTKGLPKHVEEESTDREDQRAEKAGKKVTKDIEYDDAKDRKEKKSKTVKETDAAPKAAGKGAYKFGGGVYEGLNRAYQQQLNEGMSVNISIDEAGNKTVNVTATQEDAAALADLLNLAGMQHTAASSSSCDQGLEENSPDWPTNTETLSADPELRTYSGGVDGPKSTGQSVQDGGSIPDLRRSAMGENVDLERSLFKLYQQFK